MPTKPSKIRPSSISPRRCVDRVLVLREVGGQLGVGERERSHRVAGGGGDLGLRSSPRTSGVRSRTVPSAARYFWHCVEERLRRTLHERDQPGPSTRATVVMRLRSEEKWIWYRTGCSARSAM